MCPCWNSGVGKVEISSSKCVGIVRIFRDPPVNSFGKSSSAHSRGWYVPQNRAIMHNANDSLRCCNVKLCVSVKFQSYVKKNNINNFLFHSNFYVTFWHFFSYKKKQNLSPKKFVMGDTKIKSSKFSSIAPLTKIYVSVFMAVQPCISSSSNTEYI